MGISLGTAGVLLVWLGMKSRAGSLRRNYVAGLRTRATLTDDETWTAAQRAGWVWTTAAGVVSVITGVLILFRPSNAVGAAVAIGGTVIVLSLALLGGIKGEGAARAVLASRPGGKAGIQRP